MANGCLRVRHNFVFIFNFHKTTTNKHIVRIPKNVKKDGQFQFDAVLHILFKISSTVIGILNES